MARLCGPVSSLIPLVQTLQVDCDHSLHWSIRELHVLAEIFRLDILYLNGKIPLSMRNTSCRLTWGTPCPQLAKSVHSGIRAGIVA